MAKRFWSGATISLLAGAATVLGVAVLLAGQEIDSPSAPPAPPQIPMVSDAALKSYSAARREIDRIRGRYAPARAGAAATDDSLEHAQDMQGEVLDALQRHGLTLVEYDRIHEAAQHDPRIQQTIEGLARRAP